jgi:hypothetical protein
MKRLFGVGLLGILIFPMSSHSQDGVQEAWVRHFAGPDSNDTATALAVDTHDNVYVTGISQGNDTGSDFATIKYDSNGVEQWVARYNGPANSNDAASAIVVDGDGNIYVTGFSTGVGSGWDYTTIKYNSNGIQRWVARYDGLKHSEDAAIGVAVDNNGNVYVTGSSSSGKLPDYVTIKYDSTGVEKWVVRYNGPGDENDFAEAIAVDTLGNVYVTGSSWGKGTHYDYATIKYDVNGQEKWVARYNGPVSSPVDKASDLAIDKLGNVYVTGMSGLIMGIKGRANSGSFVTIKYNDSGKEQWVARFSGSSSGIQTDSSAAITIDAKGSVYVTGKSNADFTDFNYITIKYNSAGAQELDALYAGPDTEVISSGTSRTKDEPTDIVVDHLGNVYVTGLSEGYGKNWNYITIKYESDTFWPAWIAKYDGPARSDDYAVAIEVGEKGDVFVTGSSKGEGWSIYTTIKYVSSQSE